MTKISTFRFSKCWLHIFSKCEGLVYLPLDVVESVQQVFNGGSKVHNFVSVEPIVSDDQLADDGASDATITKEPDMYDGGSEASESVFDGDDKRDPNNNEYVGKRRSEYFY